MPKNPKKSSKTTTKITKNAARSHQKPLEGTDTPKQGTTAVRKNHPTWALLLALIIVVGGSILFLGGLSGWFGTKKVTLSPEYYASDTTLTNSDGQFLERLTPERYQELADAGKSFIIFVDQNNCQVADRVRGFIENYANEFGLKPYRMMFSDMRTTSLHDTVKYYPSVIVIENGQLRDALDASAEDDAEIYNDYGAFKTWLSNLVR